MQGRPHRSYTINEPQAFKITVNTTSFNAQNASLRQRTQKEYIPKYWQKCRMDQKHITPSKQDRLSQLTTTQIDRIIQNQKIRSLLYDKKRKISDKYFHYQEDNPNVHSNVYQANFLAKINEIALRRNIKYESEGFDSFTKKDGDDFIDKLKNNVPFTYTQEYFKNYQNFQYSRKNKPKIEKKQLQDVKSIESIHADLDSFEVALQDKKQSRSKQHSRNTGRKSQRKQFKLLPSNRWFYGMSTHYLDKGKDTTEDRSTQYFKSVYDIQSETRQVQTINPRAKKHFRATNYSSKSCNRTQRRKAQPMGQFKTNRLTTIS